jgi:hypothetical protein
MMEETDIKNEIVGLYNSLSLLGGLPDGCLICNKEFNSKDEEMAFSWKVVVMHAGEKVNIYCPACWDDAMKLSMLQYDVEEE